MKKTFHCWVLWNNPVCSLLGLPGDRTYCVNTIDLLRNGLEKAILWWHWKNLSTLIVQVFQETELLEWMCWPFSDGFLTIQLWKGVVVLKGLLLQFLLWDNLVVLKGLILYHFQVWMNKTHFGWFPFWDNVVTWKNRFWIISHWPGCGSFKITDFG